VPDGDDGFRGAVQQERRWCGRVHVCDR
jgi:hypothetical protein